MRFINEFLNGFGTCPKPPWPPWLFGNKNWPVTRDCRIDRNSTVAASILTCLRCKYNHWIRVENAHWTVWICKERVKFERFIEEVLVWMMEHNVHENSHSNLTRISQFYAQWACVASLYWIVPYFGGRRYKDPWPRKWSRCGIIPSS